jgi:hypothetical protein
MARRRHVNLPHGLAILRLQLPQRGGTHETCRVDDGIHRFDGLQGLIQGLQVTQIAFSPVNARMVDTGSAATQPLHTPAF